MNRLSADTRRTLGALIGAMLGVLPLCMMFRTQQWLATGWFVMVLAVGPAALIRNWFPARVWQLVPGLLLSAEWLLIRGVPTRLLFGLLPTGGTWSDLGHLVDQLHTQVTDEVAPVVPTTATTFAVCALSAAIALVVDLLAVQARHPALAGLPLLVVFLASGTVVRGSVHWFLFVPAAAGFLLILAVDARSELQRWGPVIGRPGGFGLGGLNPRSSAERIGALALVAALVLALLVPLHAGNWLADALRSGAGGSGTSGGTSLDIAPFAELKGQLTRPTPTPLMRLKLGGPGAGAAYYLRASVLTSYTGEGWQAGPVSGTSAAKGPFTTTLASGGGTRVDFVASVTTLAGGDIIPTFAVPTKFKHLPKASSWSPDFQVVTGSIDKNTTFTEDVDQPAPTQAELREAGPGGQSGEWTGLPTGIPNKVIALTNSLTKGLSAEFDRASAITNYFLNPANGFTYSLKTASGDSGSALVDFLTNKTGFCQQFAAAATVMMRLAGVPARVALGYTYGAAAPDGSLTVTSANAHAWTEVYFAGVGWVPFDATPVAGLPGAATQTPSWLSTTSTGPSQGASTGPTAPRSSLSTAPHHRDLSAGPSGAAKSSVSGSGGHGLAGWQFWLTVLAVVAAMLILSVPAWARVFRRRRRLVLARGGESEALWAELSATARDLGYVWSHARTPRQVAQWLEQTAGTSAAQSLADAVEAGRYGRPGRAALLSEVRDLQAVEAGLRRGRSRTRRMRARLLPVSLGWRLLQRGAGHS